MKIGTPRKPCAMGVGARRIIRLAIYSLLAVLLSSGGSLAADPSASDKSVLIIYSFNDKMPWQSLARKGLTEVLGASRTPLTLYEEQMDANRFPGPAQADSFKEYLERKYAGARIDVLVTESGPASLLVAEHPNLFAGVPRLLVNPAAGVVERSKNDPSASLIVVKQEIIKSFDAMLEATGAKRVAVVGETATPLVRQTVEQLRASRPSGFNGTAIDFLLDLPMDSLLDRLRGLPSESAVFYVLMFRDGDGQPITPYQAARRIAEAAPVPVFSHWDSLMGSGIAGGYVLSGQGVGKAAAQRILNLLAGETARSGKDGVINQTHAHIYDWRVLQRHGVDPARLPRDSVLQNQQPSLWSQYWPYILGAASLVAFLSIMVSLLALALRQRRGALRALAEERGLLEARVRERTEELQLSNQRLEQLNQDISAKNHNLETALAEIDTLRGILPICANCKKIRDDQGYWNQVETYVSRRSQAVFSHAICPDCVRMLYPDLADTILDDTTE